MKFHLTVMCLCAGTILWNPLEAQHKSQIGLNVFTEIYSTPQVRPAGGLVYQYRLSEKQALQTALLYRTARMQGIIQYNPGQSFIFTVSRRYVSTYVLYKRYVGRYAFSAGPSLEYFSSWKQKDKDGGHPIETYTETPRLTLGFLTTVSREFALSSRFTLEPQLRFGNTRGINFAEPAMLSVGVIAWWR